MEINNVKIEFLGHSGFLITNGDGKKIVIDPYNISEKVGKVDFILITHSHYDHCSIKDIEKIVKPGTVVVVPPDVQSKITKIDNVNMQVIEAGDGIDFEKFKVEALPAYNTGKEFHTKADGWLGYLIKFDKVIIYHSGDCDKMPEMEKLTGYGKHGQEFVALLPVSGKYVMDADEAAEVAAMLNVDLAIPMHYGAGVVGVIDDAKKFVEVCKQLGIYAQILEKI
jgi:L-ascorbate metabolism protein UlaG (beta-lactamase superfamily)